MPRSQADIYPRDRRPVFERFSNRLNDLSIFATPEPAVAPDRSSDGVRSGCDPCSREYS